MKKSHALIVKGCAAIAIAAVLFALFRFHPFDDDEFQHSHIGWLIWQGQTPYVDFFEHHFAQYHLMLSGLFALGSHAWQLFIWRGASLLFALGTLYFTWLLCRRKEDHGVSAALAILLVCGAPIFIFKALEIRPGSAGLFFLMWAAWLALRRTNSKMSLSLSLVAGLIAGTAVMMSQKFICAGGGLFLFILIVHGLRAAGWFTIGGLFAALPFVGWITMNGALKEFYEFCFVMNANWKRTFSPEGYLTELFHTSGPLVVLGVMGILYPIFCKPQERRYAAGLLCFLAGAALAIFMVPVPFRQVFLPLFPLFAIGAARIIFELLQKYKESSGVLVGCLALVIMSLLPGIKTCLEDLRLGNRDDLQRIAKIELLDPAPNPVFDARGLMFYRQHVGFHGCMHAGILEMQDKPEYTRGVIAALEAENFPTVILDYRVKKLPIDIQNFIAKNYLAIDSTQIHQYGINIDRSKLSRRSKTFVVKIDGSYRAQWEGGKIFIDGNEIAVGAELLLKAGPHKVKAQGFISQLQLILVKRDSAQTPKHEGESDT